VVTSFYSILINYSTGSYSAKYERRRCRTLTPVLGKTGKESILVIFKDYLIKNYIMESPRRDLFIDMVVDIPKINK